MIKNRIGGMVAFGECGKQPALALTEGYLTPVNQVRRLQSMIVTPKSPSKYVQRSTPLKVESFERYIGLLNKLTRGHEDNVS